MKYFKFKQCLFFLLALLTIISLAVNIYLNIINNSNQPATSSLNDQQTDWSVFKNGIYFKKTASYYFIDLNLINLNFITRKNIRFNFSLYIKLISTTNNEIKQEFKILNKNLKINKIMTDYFNSDLIYYSLDAYINLSSIHQLNNFCLSVLVYDNLSAQNSSQEFDLKLKYFSKFKTTNSTAICTKSLFLQTYDDLEQLIDWIYLNLERFGYSHLEFFIPKRNRTNINQLNNYIKSLMSFKLNINYLNSFPIYSINYTHKLTVDYFEEYLNQNGIKNKYKTYQTYDLINELLLNECYLNNIDKYKFIAVLDSDEIILPRYYKDFSYDSFIEIYKNYIKNGKLKLNNLNKLIKSSSTDISSFMYKLTSIYRNESEQEHTYGLFFKPGWMLKNSLIKNLCNYLNEYKSKRKLKKLPVYFNLTDDDEMSFRFKLVDHESILYSNTLCDILNQIENNDRKNFLLPRSANFNRFFFVKFDYGGKTVHNTDKVFNVITHFKKRVKLNNAKRGFKMFMFNERLDVDNSLAYMSHFRNGLSILSSGLIIELKQICVDFNYYFQFLKNK